MFTTAYALRTQNLNHQFHKLLHTVSTFYKCYKRDIVLTCCTVCPWNTSGRTHSDNQFLITMSQWIIIQHMRRNLYTVWNMIRRRKCELKKILIWNIKMLQWGDEGCVTVIILWVGWGIDHSRPIFFLHSDSPTFPITSSYSESGECSSYTCYSLPQNNNEMKTHWISPSSPG